MMSSRLSPVILGQAQTGLHGHQHKGVITPARPGALIRRREQGVDFGTRQEVDQSTGEALAGDGEHPLDLCGMSRRFESRVTKEGMNRCEAQISRCERSRLGASQVLQKRHDQRRIDLLEVQL